MRVLQSAKTNRTNNGVIEYVIRGGAHGVAVSVEAADRVYVAHGHVSARYEFVVQLKRYNGVAWEPLGISGTDTGLTGGGLNLFPKLALTPAGLPVVSYWNNFVHYVRAWTGSSWVLVGGAAVNADGFATEHSDLVVDAEGRAHLSWQKLWYNQANGLWVRRFDGIGWRGYGQSDVGYGLHRADTGATISQDHVVWTQPHGGMGVALVQYQASDAEAVLVRGYDPDVEAWAPVGDSDRGTGINEEGQSVRSIAAVGGSGSAIVAYGAAVRSGGTYVPVVRQHLSDWDGDGLSDRYEQSHGLLLEYAGYGWRWAR